MPPNTVTFHSIRTVCNRKAFPITETELKLMAAAAIIGLSNQPKVGYKIPAAIATRLRKKP